MVQNQWYHFGIGAPPILVYFSGDWAVLWGYGVLAHGHMMKQELAEEALDPRFWSPKAPSPKLGHWSKWQAVRFEEHWRAAG